MIFTLLLMLQISIAEIYDLLKLKNVAINGNYALILILFVNVFKFNLELMVVAYQTYEWFALWFMMNFQKCYDIY